MNPKNRNALEKRVVKAAEAALAARGYASPIDVLVGIGWLDAGKLEQWRRGQVDYLESAVQTNLSRISEAMKLFRSWAAERGLSASETSYVARSPQRQALRFSKSGTPTNRSAVPHPLGVAGAFRAETPTPGGEGKPRPGAGRDPAIEQGVEVPPMRQNR
jgi:hypothetical protein